MESLFTSITSVVDPVVAAVAIPLAFWILANGLDDLLVDFIGLQAFDGRKTRSTPALRRALNDEPQRRIAVMVPCWREHEVIGRMVQQNACNVRYGNWDLFVGAYPNDQPTVDVVTGLAKRYRNVHLALCPHDGPTSKADCLNWIYQRIRQRESEDSERYEVLVTHDAEDVIHPDAFHWINLYSKEYSMVQVPVLPLPTPVTAWVHGVYCDEFAEYQIRDMPARQAMGAFVPSNGVGTGFRRDAIETLADEANNRIFEPVCLTEDYENGLRLKLLGASQIFLPIHTEGVATREFFPCTFSTAVRQRTRWVTGIALQTWDRHGWKGTWADKYWLWRDRKGLLGNPLSVLANALFCYGSLTALFAALLGIPWGLQIATADYQSVFIATTLLSVHRFIYRILSSVSIYGWVFALGLPVRMIVANTINSLAAFGAIRQFCAAKISSQPLVWLKTDHQYPSEFALLESRKKIGEILVGSGYVEEADLLQAVASKPAGMRIGEHLVNLGLITIDELYEVLALQLGMSHEHLDPREIPRALARALPAKVIRESRAVPFRVEFGNMLLAVADPPAEELRSTIQQFTRLQVRFHLVTPQNLEQLVKAAL